MPLNTSKRFLSCRRITLAAVLVALGVLATELAPTAAPASVPRRHPAVARVTLRHAPVALAAAAGETDGGFTPAGLRAAYGLPTHGARHQTIAILSVFHDAQAQTDLNAYDARFRLPACTVANRCLRILNEHGQPTPLPGPDTTGGQWIAETGIGLQIGHAVCPGCSLILIELNAPDKAEIAYAAKAAAAAGATVIETAATPSEDASDGQYAGYGFDNSPAAIVAAVGDPNAGDYGYSGAVNFPSSLPSVIGVGGTHLGLTRNGGYGGESAWRGTVSGCSAYQYAPAWQRRDARKVGCGALRAVSDVAAIADPGALVHLTGTETPGGPWYVATGTSLSSPVIAGIIGLAGSAGSREAQMLYAHAASEPAALHDVRTGSNSTRCSIPICRAERGYDAPTGLGTPRGLAAFLPNGGALSASRPLLSLPPPDLLRVNRGWRAGLRVRNDNPFAVQVRLWLRDTVREGGRARTVMLGRGVLTLEPLSAATVSVQVSPSCRRLLFNRGEFSVSGLARGTAGKSVRLTRHLTGVVHSS